MKNNNMINIEIFLGIGLAIISAILYNLAPVIQKEAIISEKRDTKNAIHFIIIIFTNRKWIFGLFLTLLAMIPYYFSLKLIGLIYTIPIMSIGLVFLIIFSKLRLNEVINKEQLIGIIFLTFVPIALIFSVNEVINFNINNFSSISYKFTIYLSSFFIFSIILFIFFSKRILILSIPTGIFFSLASISMQYASYYYVNSNISFNKLLSFKIFDQKYIIYIFILFLVLLFNFIAGIIMQFGIKGSKITLFNPIKQSLNILISITGGVVIFNQSISNPILYSLGIFFIIIGLVSTNFMKNKGRENIH